MATHVYANGQEIACKAAGGVAPAAFPDPCWSPPPPPAGPVVIPYSNSTHASKIRKGTHSVFIKGQTVAIEDKSYFVNSTGNEPATYAFGKGLVTGALKGKAYFRSWSMDVKFEGRGVARHHDLVSHNHGSYPSNTALFPYVSRSFIGRFACKEEEKRIERACEADGENSDTKKELKKKSKLANLFKKIKKPKPANAKGKPKKWHWIDDHCGGLGIPLTDAEKAKEYADKLSEVFQALPEELNAMSMLEPWIKDTLTNAATKVAEKLGIKAFAKQVAGTAVPGWGNAAMAASSVLDALSSIKDIVDMKNVTSDALEQLGILREKKDTLSKLAEKFEDFPNKLGQGETIQSIATDGQELLATLNACTRARKCNLVPYSSKPRKSNIEPATNGGCCPGQTGHHLIYDSMVVDRDEYGTHSRCPGKNGYKTSEAPTVCVEGTNQHLGSHGRIHDFMDVGVGKIVENRAPLTNGFAPLSIPEAIDAAVKSHQAAFPLSKCRPACIRAQLEAYYSRACQSRRLLAKNKNGKPHATDKRATNR